MQTDILNSLWLGEKLSIQTNNKNREINVIGRSWKTRCHVNKTHIYSYYTHW